MSNPRYPEEFKIQAVNQVTEKKLPVAEVAARLGASTCACRLIRSRKSSSGSWAARIRKSGVFQHICELDRRSPKKYLVHSNTKVDTTPTNITTNFITETNNQT